MPVLEGLFVPRTTLTAAEAHVDFLGHNTHILERRRIVEKAGTLPTRQLVVLTVDYPALAHAYGIERLAGRLAASLDATARFGYREARRELAALRQAQRVTARYAIPDAGRHAHAARAGLPAVLDLVRRRSYDTALAVANATTLAAHKASLARDTAALATVTNAALRTLHNHVLELVGETLNLGRTAGAMSLTQPPEFALRSEQLDKNTCDACERVHGTVVEVGTDEFYRLSPPAECYGGGRCRGIWVFGFDRGDVDMPQAA